MQAMQAIPVAPQPAAPPAAPPAAHQSGSDHFSQHLDKARKRADKPGHEAKGKGNTGSDHDKKAGATHHASDENSAHAHKTEKTESGQTSHTDHLEHGKGDSEQGNGNSNDLLQQVERNSQSVPQTTAADTEIPIILKVDNSTPIQDTGLSASVRDRESIVAAVLGKVTGEQDNASAAQTKETGPQEQTGTGQKPFVVEHWQARFNYTTEADQGKNGKFSQTQQGTPGMTLTAQAVQSQVSPANDQNIAQAHGTPGTGLEAPAMPQDANSNYIHSNLPGATTIPDSDAAAGNKQQTGQGDQGAAKNSMQTPDLQMVANQNGQDVPLVFSLDQTSAQTGQVSGQDSSGSLSLHLPSGIEIPHSQIIDQVTGHFAVNRSLESGTVTIRLHPAELGELRMEIKVEQDNIKAHITAQNPQVQDILDRNLPRLREALQQQGMNLEHMQVSVATDGGNSQLFQEQFTRRQFKSPGQSNNGRTGFALPEEDQEIPLSVASDQNLSVHI